MRWCDLQKDDTLVGNKEFVSEIFFILGIRPDGDWEILVINRGVFTALRGDDGPIDLESWEVFRP